MLRPGRCRLSPPLVVMSSCCCGFSYFSRGVHNQLRVHLRVISHPSFVLVDGKNVSCGHTFVFSFLNNVAEIQNNFIRHPAA